MKSVLDQVKSWREPESVRSEETIETRPVVEEVKLRKKAPAFVPNIDLPKVLYNFMNQIQTNINTGIWELDRNWKHMLAYNRSCRQFNVFMESLEPDDEFRNDIIAAEREPDYVEQGNAMFSACQRLMIRRKIGLKQKGQMGIFDEDLEELYSHLPEIDEDDDTKDYE